MENREIGKFISKLRKSKGLTQNELADMLNISNKTISKWETGEGLPDISVLPELAKSLGVTVDEILNAELKDEASIKIEEVANEKNLLNIFHICFLISCFVCAFGSLLGGFSEIYSTLCFRVLFYTHWEIIVAAVAFFCIVFGNLLFYISALRLNVIYTKEKILALTYKKAAVLFLISLVFILTFLIRIIDHYLWLPITEFAIGTLLYTVAVILCTVWLKKTEKKYK
ncbi:MAG: helix-turn-helix transcriptional regulator [Ruminococcaceae bacterium]|jgi:transcriptional regulator with XRE-family HTH domain|nr:helix-turn-helix transcriptional regulator [Oscillospiraceae bacterium]